MRRSNQLSQSGFVFDGEYFGCWGICMLQHGLVILLRYPSPVMRMLFVLLTHACMQSMSTWHFLSATRSTSTTPSLFLFFLFSFCLVRVHIFRMYTSLSTTGSNRETLWWLSDIFLQRSSNSNNSNTVVGDIARNKTLAGCLVISGAEAKKTAKISEQNHKREKLDTQKRKLKDWEKNMTRLREEGWNTCALLCKREESRKREVRAHGPNPRH